MGDIELKNVWFKYPNSNEFVLKNLNLTIKEGEKIAIVGRTGSGKTTLVQLIPRLYDITEGEVIIDGKNVKKVLLNELRSMIGYVPQGTFCSQIRLVIILHLGMIMLLRNKLNMLHSWL